MKDIMVYCQSYNGSLLGASLELVSKGRELADTASSSLIAVLVGDKLTECAEELQYYGVDHVYIAESASVKDFTAEVYTKIICSVVKIVNPRVLLLGASLQGRELAPRVAAELHVGITADCSKLELKDYTDENGKTYENVLFQMRPSFVGNQLTTIIEPDSMPQMASVREGVMQSHRLDEKKVAEVHMIDVDSIITPADLALVQVLEQIAKQESNNLKSASIVLAGGYGIGSKETFDKLYVLADLLGGAEVGATRAAVDAGYVEHDRMIGQTGLTVAPKLYFAFGISGQLQHTVGMEKSSIIVAINTDPDAPIHKMADYSIVDDSKQTIDKMIKLLHK